MVKHENFNEVESIELRTYNRATMALNLLTQYGEDEVKQYFQQFDEAAKKGIMALLIAIKFHGKDAVRQKVLKDATLN